MKILITGVTGFIGSHLVKELSKDKIGEIYGVVRFGNRYTKHEGYEPIYADITDYHYLAKIISEIKPEIVIHLAALSSVSQSFERPQEYFLVNTIGTINLAEINLKFNPYLKKFIWAGTPEEYGIQTNFPIKEDAVLNPNSPYAVSKTATTQYLLYLHRTYDFPVVISRHANAYGRKLGIFSQLGVIENTVTQMLKGSDVYLGEPDVRRDFLYIDDVVEWYKVLMEKSKEGEIYNAGWGKSYSIKEVAEIAMELIGFTGEIHWHSIPKRPGEIPRIELDSSKARRELGWKPKINLEEGLTKTIEYFRSHS
jgi:nucleoside-diphosphate-sugar epimerase